jgi:hypothetical protein
MKLTFKEYLKEAKYAGKDIDAIQQQYDSIVTKFTRSDDLYDNYGLWFSPGNKNPRFAELKLTVDADNISEAREKVDWFLSKTKIPYTDIKIEHGFEDEDDDFYEDVFLARIIHE